MTLMLLLLLFMLVFLSIMLLLSILLAGGVVEDFKFSVTAMVVVHYVNIAYC